MICFIVPSVCKIKLHIFRVYSLSWQRFLKGRFFVFFTTAFLLLLAPAGGSNPAGPIAWGNHNQLPPPPLLTSFPLVTKQKQVLRHKNYLQAILNGVNFLNHVPYVKANLCTYFFN